MQRFDVWIYYTNTIAGADPREEFFGTFEGYISEITVAALNLHPLAVGILIEPERPE